MQEGSSAETVVTLELPADAPRVRITAGVGSPAQKVWTIRRPVTLIGSKRPAHIVLHDCDISAAHCVIVNTGTHVLIKDLHTEAGTTCGTSRIDLAILNDGDVIHLGATSIQVAVQMSVTPGAAPRMGYNGDDATTLRKPLSLTLAETDRRWPLREAVTLLGRLPDAPVCLDHEDVSTRRAIIFRFENGTAIYDLDGREATAVNGRPCASGRLAEGDRITIGPFSLLVAAASGPDPTAKRDDESSGLPKLLDVSQIESELDVLRRNIAESWATLNTWSEETEQDEQASPSPDAAPEELDTRMKNIDVREAELRGRLHDLTQLHGQLVAREQDLRSHLSRVQHEHAALTKSRAAVATQTAELSRRAEELTRREQAVAQRWSRLQTACCPDCGRRLGSADSGSNNPVVRA